MWLLTSRQSLTPQLARMRGGSGPTDSQDHALEEGTSPAATIRDTLALVERSGANRQVCEYLWINKGSKWG